MIGKRIALTITTLVLGVGLAVTPASVSLARCKCGPHKKACKAAFVTLYNCTGFTTRAEKKTCKRAQAAAIKGNCRSCVAKTCSSPSGAFLD
jgi:hypothetical protein